MFSAPGLSKLVCYTKSSYFVNIMSLQDFTMLRTVCLILIFNYCNVLVSVHSSPTSSKDSISYLDQTADVIKQYGYDVEVHHAITADGYVLGLHRIPEGKKETLRRIKPVVFLMHGITGASHHWVFGGPDISAGYHLADAGFDVWIGNARGNKKSRAHLNLDPNDYEEKYDFFDFTWEEIGMYDVPAMIDYILEQTGREKLHYIGHSQGGTVYLVMNSMKPENNEKIASAHLMAGVGYMEHFPSLPLRALAANTQRLYEMALRLGIVELYSENVAMSESGVNCVDDKELLYLCEELGINTFMNESRISTIVSAIGGSGVSLKQFAHYGQNVNSKLFRRWDYGNLGNIAAYGSATPPLYDLSLITVNTTMHYTVSDALLDERDVLAMARDMPNTDVRRVGRASFSHTDFVEAPDAKELVTDYIVDAIHFVDSTLPDSSSSMTVPSLNTIAAMIILIMSLLRW